ncbi:hypothetical protein LLE49_08320 [Alicyclobacillus tolerans]|nr:hypothetical protein [Alicyclobacillus tolerans]MCF8564731.1 hypothetical protein [Alicyclobacillus tolerans]
MKRPELPNFHVNLEIEQYLGEMNSEGDVNPFLSNKEPVEEEPDSQGSVN